MDRRAYLSLITKHVLGIDMKGATQLIIAEIYRRGCVSAEELKKLVGQSKRDWAIAKNIILRLIREGRIKRVSRGVYCRP